MMVQTLLMIVQIYVHNASNLFHKIHRNLLEWLILTVMWMILTALLKYRGNNWRLILIVVFQFAGDIF